MKDHKVAETTASYRELGSQTYGLFVEHFAQANQRGLAYWKSLWELAAKPYSDMTFEAAVKENFERAGQIVSLTVSELQTSGTKAAELTEKVVSHNAKWQDSAAQSFRGMVGTGISNVNFVKEAATQQLDDIAKRLDEVQARTTTTIHSN